MILVSRGCFAHCTTRLWGRWNSVGRYADNVNDKEAKRPSAMRPVFGYGVLRDSVRA